MVDNIEVLRGLVEGWRQEAELIECDPDVFACLPKAYRQHADELEAALAALGRKGEARDWAEDFAHENGQYSSRCVTCSEMFVGHKRRVTCRLCATQPEAQGEAVAWHILHEDGGSHVMLAESVDEKFRDALAANGRNLRPLIYGDTTAPKSPVEAKGVAVAEEFAAWLETELPAGTIIGNPRWLANRIARQFVPRGFADRYTAAPKVAEGVEAVELTVCCGREECGGECGNEWRGTHWVRKAAPKPGEGVTDAMVERAAAVIFEEETGDPWVVADTEHTMGDRDYWRGIARKALTAAQQQEKK